MELLKNIHIPSSEYQEIIKSGHYKCLRYIIGNASGVILNRKLDKKILQCSVICNVQRKILKRKRKVHLN